MVPQFSSRLLWRWDHYRIERKCFPSLGVHNQTVKRQVNRKTYSHTYVTTLSISKYTFHGEWHDVKMELVGKLLFLSIREKSENQVSFLWTLNTHMRIFIV